MGERVGRRESVVVVVVDLVDSQAKVQHYVTEGNVGANVLQTRQTLECVCAAY